MVKLESKSGNVVYVEGFGNVVAGGNIYYLTDEDKVSITQLKVDHSNVEKTLLNVIAEIDVEVSENSLGRINPLPFIPFPDFNKVFKENKIFFFGKSGCGKSRAIIEFVKAKLSQNSKINNIYLINPRSETKNSWRNTLDELISKVNVQDLIIWDNFPDDLNGAVFLQKGLVALAKISSARTKNMILSLNPKLLEKYRMGINTVWDYFKSLEIIYKKNDIRSMLKKYGELDTFQPLFETLIKDNIDKISEILYHKEPSPFIVIQYYRILHQEFKKENYEYDDGQAIEHALRMQPMDEYYSNQIPHLEQDRKAEADFLYTVKFCYELGWDRRLADIKNMQKILFDSDSPQEPETTLSSWIYITYSNYSNYYSIHDLARQSLQYGPYRKRQMVEFISNNFGKFDLTNAQLYLLAYFIGQNIQTLPINQRENQIVPILSDDMFYYMMNSPHFCKGLANGLGEVFTLLESDFQRSILDLAHYREEIAFPLPIKLAEIFEHLESMVLQNLLQVFAKYERFAYRFGNSLGWLYYSYDKPTQKKVLEFCDENEQVRLGFAERIGKNFSSYDETIQQEILELVHKNNEFAYGIGAMIGSSFDECSSLIKNKILELAAYNAFFAEGLARYIFVDGFFDSDYRVGKRLPDKFPELFDRSPTFTNRLGFRIGYSFKLGTDQAQTILELADIYNNLAYGIGSGIGNNHRDLRLESFFYLNRDNDDDDYLYDDDNYFTKEEMETRMKFLRSIEKNGMLARGFGEGVGETLSSHLSDVTHNEPELSKNQTTLTPNYDRYREETIEWLRMIKQSWIIELANRNSFFAYGLGRSMAYSFRRSSLQESLRCIKNDRFAFGFGEGVGERIDKIMADDIFHDISFAFRIARENANWAAGLCSALQKKSPLLSDELKKIISDNVKEAKCLENLFNRPA